VGVFHKKRCVGDRGTPPTPDPSPTASRGRGKTAHVGALRPHQRHRFREIADVIIRQRDSTGSVRSVIRSRINPG